MAFTPKSDDEDSFTESSVILHEVKGYQFEPFGEAMDEREDDVLELQSEREQVIQQFKDTSQWCKCSCCQVMPTRLQNRCCQVIESCKSFMNGKAIRCITDHEWFHQLLADGPLHITYVGYLRYHDDIFPKQPTEQDKQRKKRFCAYRSMVFWLYLELKKGQRRPLPTCMYSAIQAMFPPTANEEDFADWRFSEYVN